jgi:hypothetical protein
MHGNCRTKCSRFLCLVGLAWMTMASTTNALLSLSRKQDNRVSYLYSNIRSGDIDLYRVADTDVRRPLNDDSTVRGNLLLPLQRCSSTLALGLIMVTALTLLPPTADATYSAYTHREEDWQQRMSSGGIQVSNPKMLRDQLRAIAPMNDESSFLFCPNGPSAAVSPLMENRCGDRQATPSVFGRSDDVLGNSIPGFSKDWTSTVSSASAADTGGLPEYGFTAGRKTK